jgi:hypothetical protein
VIAYNVTCTRHFGNSAEPRFYNRDIFINLRGRQLRRPKENTWAPHSGTSFDKRFRKSVRDGDFEAVGGGGSGWHSWGLCTDIKGLYCSHQNNDVVRRFSFAIRLLLLLPLTARQGAIGVDNRSLPSRYLSVGDMSITAYLDGFDADLETKQVLGVALEKTRVSLGLADNFANGIIAKRLIELAKAGEHNPDLLCRGAIEQLRGFLFGD